MAGLTFTRKMQGQLCAPGENATFEAAASTGAGVTATWLKDSAPLDDKLADRVKITSKGNLFTLSLTGCQPGDSRQYTCRVTESGGATATCTANLEVHSLSAAEKKQREESSHPVFIVKLRNSELIKDAAASFMIHCRGNPTPDIKYSRTGLNWWRTAELHSTETTPPTAATSSSSTRWRPVMLEPTRLRQSTPMARTRPRLRSPSKMRRMCLLC